MNILMCSHLGCGANATISCLKDPFGKSDEYVSYCPKHAPGLLAGTQAMLAPSISEKWDSLLPPTPGGMRARMLADEELSEEEFERQAHRIALEAHEDRLKLWETALERWARLERLESQSDATVKRA